MANATYDNIWQEAIGELSEQLHVEGVDDEEEEGIDHTEVIIYMLHVYVFLHHIYHDIIK